MEHSKRGSRRRHDDELKAKVLSECSVPGASVAQVALVHGLNANLVHKWRRQAGGTRISVTAPEMTTFIPVTMAPAMAPVVDDIRIELRRGALAVNVTWPLAELEFVERRQCVHFLGPPGTGKSHLAIALGFEAVKAGKSVFFATLAELVDSMRKAEREGKLRERVKFLSRYSLLVVDEIGYLPVGSGGGNLFFQLVNACYERCAMIMTGNRGFGEWADIFGDAVVATPLLDRLLHHAVVVPIEGNSYRLREHAALIPEHLRGRSPMGETSTLPTIKRGPGRPRKEANASPPG